MLLTRLFSGSGATESSEELFHCPNALGSGCSEAHSNICGALGRLPRVSSSTKGEGTERRYFYGAVWAVCAAEPSMGLLWKVLPRSRSGDVLKLAVFVGILTCMGYWAKLGLLPRTRPIVPGEWAISD